MLAQSGSTALDDLANRLTLSITPTVLARQAMVSLHRDDVTAILNAPNISASYQWQRRDANSLTWQPILVDGNAFDYTTVATDDNHYLRLQLTLSAPDGNSNTVQLAPRYSNQTELITPNASGPLETLALDSGTNTYRLTERATLWLEKYQVDNAVSVASYQWYRIPVGGDITNNGQAITGANNDSYTLDPIDDVNFEHLLMIELSNGVFVSSARTGEWKNNGVDPNKANEIDVTLCRFHRR